MDSSTHTVNRRWWISAAVVGLLFTAANMALLYRAFLLEQRLLPDALRLSVSGVVFLVMLFTALPWGLYLLSAVVAAILVRRRAIPRPALLDVLAVAICAQAAALASCALNARHLIAAEREWRLGGDAVSAHAVFALMEPGIASDLFSTVGVGVLFGVLLRVRYPDVPLSTVFLASLAPIAVTALMLVFSLFVS